MPTTIKGILKVISRNGGIKLDNSDAWINAAPDIQKSYNIADYEKYRNQHVIVTIESGKWLLIQLDSEQPKNINWARFGMLFNRAHEEALFMRGFQHNITDAEFISIFEKLQKLAKQCEGVYNDS